MIKNIIQKLKQKYNSLTKKRKMFLFTSLSLLLVIVMVPFFVNAGVIVDALAEMVVWCYKMILYFLEWIVGMEMTILIYFMKWNLFTKGIPAVEAGWVITRDICNMFFILILLVIAFSTIIKYEAYSYKRWLPKLVAAAILINFSKTITGLAIDFSQVIMLTFVNAFKDAASGNLIVGLHLDDLFVVSDGIQAKDLTEASAKIATMVLAAIVFIIVACVLMVMISLVVSRMIVLWVLVILSPLAFFLNGTPFGASYFSKWSSELGKNLVAGPVLAFFLYLALYTIQQSSGKVIEGVSGESSSFIFSGILSEFSQSATIMNFIIVIGLLMTGLKVTQESGAAGASMAGKVSQGLSRLGKSAVRKFSGAGYVGDRVKAYNQMRAKRKDMKVQKFASGMMDVTALGKKVISAPGVWVGNKIKSNAKVKKVVDFVGRNVNKVNLAKKARDKAHDNAKKAEVLRYAKDNGVKDIASIRTTESSLNANKSTATSRMSTLASKTSMTSNEREEFGKLKEEIKGFDKEIESIGTLRDMLSNNDIEESDLNNEDVSEPGKTDKKIEDFQKKAGNAGEWAHGLSAVGNVAEDIGIGLAKVLGVGIVGCIGPVAGIITAGLFQSKAIEKSGKADKNSSESYENERTSEWAKRYVDEETGMLRKISEDLSEDFFKRMGAKLELLNRGSFGANDITKLRADLKILGAGPVTTKQFEDKIKKQFPSQYGHKEINPKTGKPDPVLNGAKVEKMSGIASAIGLSKFIGEISSSGVNKDILQVCLNASKNTKELEGVISRLAPAVSAAFAEEAHKMIKNDGDNLQASELNKLLGVFNSGFENIEKSDSTKESMSQGVLETIKTQTAVDVKKINLGNLLGGLDLASATIGKANQKFILENIKTSELLSAFKKMIDTEDEKLISKCNDLVGVIKTIKTSGGPINANTRDIIKKLEESAKLTTRNPLYNAFSNMENF